jgi:hypothetical protein
MPGRGEDHQPIDLATLDRLQRVRYPAMVLTDLKVRFGVGREIN